VKETGDKIWNNLYEAASVTNKKSEGRFAFENFFEVLNLTE